MDSRLRFSLFTLRLAVFIVMLMWTLDKFIRPEHASKVYEMFYYSPPLTSTMSYIIGGVEFLIILGFLFGVWKTFTYGMVFVLHLISTVSSWQQYLTPFEGSNLLFFAALPMLAACWTLFLLRDKDQLCTLS